MRENISVSVVSPIYNDYPVLPRTLGQLESALRRLPYQWEIVLLDDASHDGSRQWVSQYAKKHHHITVYLHSKNQGIAKTYRELYAKATGDIVVLFSLDGEWDPKDVLSLIDVIIKKHYDIAVGVRTQKRYTWWRSTVSSLYNRLTKIIFGVATLDAGSIKAFRRDVLQHITVYSHGVFDEAERLIRAAKAGYRIGFIPVHHVSASKKRRGIRVTHVVEAIFDSLRVFARMYQEKKL